jgi:hypothetical protein
MGKLKPFIRVLVTYQCSENVFMNSIIVEAHSECIHVPLEDAGFSWNYKCL